MTKTATYTTLGLVRGCCGHKHETMESADRCAIRDRRACAAVGGYSDRYTHVRGCRRVATSDPAAPCTCPEVLAAL